MRKPRYTIFLGYGEEAESLLKLFEQVKCRTGISSNIPFIKLLLTFFERSFDNDDNEVSETATESLEQNNDIDLNVSKEACEYSTPQPPIFSVEQLEDNKEDLVMTRGTKETKCQQKGDLENTGILKN